VGFSHSCRPTQQWAPAKHRRRARRCSPPPAAAGGTVDAAAPAGAAASGLPSSNLGLLQRYADDARELQRQETAAPPAAPAERWAPDGLYLDGGAVFASTLLLAFTLLYTVGVHTGGVDRALQRASRWWVDAAAAQRRRDADAARRRLEETFPNGSPADDGTE
jgi:hypothetical protein